MKRFIVFCFPVLLLCGCNQSPKKDDDTKKDDEPSTLPIGSSVADGINSFPVDDNISYCNYAGETESNKLYTFKAEAKAGEITKDVLSDVGLPSNFTVLAANVPNAMAYMYTTGDKAGKRYIFYNPKFFLDVKDSTKTDWGKISIMAHEIGHHLAGHTLTKVNRSDMELEADKFSGFILRRMGANEHDAIAAIEKMGSTKASATHPDKNTREAAILAGWEEADYKEEKIAARRKVVPPKKEPESHTQFPPGENDEEPKAELPPSDIETEQPAQLAGFKDFYIINTMAVTSEAAAKKAKEQLALDGYKAGYLWIPDYPSLSNKRFYTVYVGPFFSQFNCELAVENYRKEHPDAYGTLVSMSNKRVQINGLGKVIVKQNN